jgi:hypothetical protein
MRKIRGQALGISALEVTFARRGFRCDSNAVRERLEEAGRCFLGGYHAALAARHPAEIPRALDAIPGEMLGFAFEGAAMASSLLDALTPWRRWRLGAFLAGPADEQTYIAHVGAGWVLGRLPLSPGRLRRRLDPLLGWLALDGYGFHEGFFHWPRALVRQRVPARLRGYEKRVFDHGLGRSLWFVEGADPRRIAAVIGSFAPARQADLWAGVGLACSYAGGGESGAIAELRERAGRQAPLLAQGAAFAAKARQRAGNPSAATELACQILCGMPAAQAAAVCDAMLREPDPAPAVPHSAPSFERWRRRIQEVFAPPTEVTTA